MNFRYDGCRLFPVDVSVTREDIELYYEHQTQVDTRDYHWRRLFGMRQLGQYTAPLHRTGGIK